MPLALIVALLLVVTPPVVESSRHLHSASAFRVAGTTHERTFKAPLVNADAEQPGCPGCTGSGMRLLQGVGSQQAQAHAQGSQRHPQRQVAPQVEVTVVEDGSSPGSQLQQQQPEAQEVQEQQQQQQHLSPSLRSQPKRHPHDDSAPGALRESLSNLTQLLQLWFHHNMTHMASEWPQVRRWRCASYRAGNPPHAGERCAAGPG
jgi:hypothetical protein